MRTTRMLVLMFLAGGASAAGGWDGTVSLFVAERQADEQRHGAGTLIHEIVLVDGAVTEKREVFRSPRILWMTPSDKSQIVAGRWAVSPEGDIVDLVDRVLLFDGVGDYDYLGLDGPVTYYRSRENDVTGANGTDVFTYDLKAGRGLQKVKQPDFYRREFNGGELGSRKVFAPSRKKYAAPKEFGDSGIWVHDANGMRLLSQDMDAGASAFTSDTLIIPMLWLSESVLLTQRSNGDLVTLDMRGRVRDLVKFECSAEPVGFPRLERDLDGAIIYRCGDKRFVIDVKRGTATPYVWAPCGSGFYMADGEGDTKRLRWKGEEIGSLVCLGWASKACDGHFATPYGARHGSLMYPEGIAIWSTHKRKWEKVEFDWAEAVIGFVVHDGTRNTVAKRP